MADAEAKTSSGSRGWATVLSVLSCMLPLAVILSTALPDTNRFLRSELLDGIPSILGLVGMIGYGLLALCSCFKPQFLARRQIAVGAAVSVAVFSGLLIAGRQLSVTAPFAAGIALYSLVYVWMTLLTGINLARLHSIKLASIAVVGAIILRQLAVLLFTLDISPTIEVCVMGAASLASLLVLTHTDRPILQTLDQHESLNTLELTNPLSSLWPLHRLFFGTLLISSSYMTTTVLGVPTFSFRRLLVVIPLFLLLWFLLVQRSKPEDQLFSLTALFVMIGLLVAPLLPEYDNFISNTFLFLGYNCFTILLWLVAYSLGRRNIIAMISAFCPIGCMDMLGRILGEGLGELIAMLAETYMRSSQTVLLILALIFFADIWFIFHSISFTNAIYGIEKITDVVSKPQDQAETPVRRYQQRCQELANDAALTPREIEVFELLANGRNARFIMDRLCISRNTTKTHIARIYTKLGVHSQQELISLIQDNE